MPPKRRRKYHGLYYHSSPPKVLPMNGNSNSSKASGRDENKEAFVVKPSSIRIWIHDKDVGKLTRVLWAGHGNRLRTETSANPRVKKFLENVPYVLNVIKDVHQATVDNNLDLLQSKTEPPVPPSLITTKDSSGLTVMHKAAGLAHTRIVEYLLKVWPGGATDIDATGKTPLHWAASAKNNTRCYNLLVQAGADEEALDYRMKTASNYKNRPNDIDRSLLTVVPEAPRVPNEGHPDWSALIDEVGKLTNSELDLTADNENNNSKNDDISNGNGINLLTTRTNANAIEDISEPDDLEDGNSKLTIEEQAIQDAIEDERLYEQEQSEMEAIRQEEEENDEPQAETQPDEQEDLVENNADLNGSGKFTPPSSPTPTANLVEDDEGVEAKQATQLIDENEDARENTDDDNLIKSSVKEIEAEGEERVVEASNNLKNAMSTEENDLGKVEAHQISNANIEIQDNNTIDVHFEKNELMKDIVKTETSAESTEKAENKDNGKNSPEKMKMNDPPVSQVDEQTAEKDAENEHNDKNDSEMESDFHDDGANADKHEQVTVDPANLLDKKQEIESTLEKSGHITPTSNAVDSNVEHESDDDTIGKDTDYEKIEKPKSAKSVRNESAKSDKSIRPENATSNQGMRNGSATSNHDIRNGSATSNQSVRTGSATSNHSVRNGSAKSNHSTTSSSNTPVKEPLPNSETNNEKDKNINTNNNSIEPISLSPEKSPASRTSDAKKSDEDDDDQENITSNGHHIDENHNPIKSSGGGSITPVTPALEYEGVVQGEPDDNQVQSQSGGYFTNEADQIQSIIDSGDMEQLATLVLNGEGNKLLGTRSNQPEIQAFLDNVPSYMNKIRRVHQASRNGNIRDLQAALDRRKFAIAKDEISPNGATPLHVATIFGHAGIIRYLGGRFPETTSAVDDNGRTALHYAATINDNGHFYNLLMNLGSNPKSLDKIGNSADYYKDNRQESMKILSYQSLLKAFGASEDLENEMLSDQVPDDLHSARRPVDDVDVLSTLERCFRLLHEPNLQVDPLGSTTPSSASSLRLTVTTYLGRFLKRSIFDKIKHRQTRLDHNLFDVIWPAMKKSSKETRVDEDLNAGVVAPDFDVYVVFQEFLVPLIKDMQCMPQSHDFKPHPSLFYFPVMEGKVNNSLRVSMDESRKYIVDGFVECCRNLEEFELPLNLNIGQIEQAERAILEKVLSTEFAEAIGDSEAGTYYTMNEVLENPSEIRTILAASKLLIALLDTSDEKQEAESLAMNGQYWPYGRGVLVSSSGDLAIWINVQEHLRLVVSTPFDSPGDIGYAYSKVGRAMMFLETKMHFRESYLLGYLSSRPAYLGTALKLSLTMDLPNLMKELENLRHLCVVRGLNIIPNQTDKVVRVVNMQSLGLTEWRLFQDYCTAVTNILQLEKDMALTNSKQIATMLVKIFRRKKNSLAES